MSTASSDAAPPIALKRLYDEMNRTHRMVVGNVGPLITVNGAEYFLKQHASGIGLFVAGANSPAALMVLGATYRSGSATRGQITLFRENSSLKLPVLNQIAKEIRGKFEEEGIQVEIIKNLPVLQVGRIPGAYFQQTHEPAIPGISISASDKGADGTLGFFALAKSPGQGASADEMPTTSERTVLVSAGHVLIASERRDDVNVYHPSRDVAARQDIEPKRIGRGIWGFRPDVASVVPVDAALAYVERGVAISPNKVDSGQIVEWLSESDASEEFLTQNNFFKIGAATGLRQGYLSGTQRDVTFTILDENGFVCGIGSVRNLLIVNSIRDDENFSSDKDSGAPVFVEKERGKYILCGIVIGGLTKKALSSGPSRSFVCPIWTIQHHLGITPIRQETPVHTPLEASP